MIFIITLLALYAFIILLILKLFGFLKKEVRIVQKNHGDVLEQTMIEVRTEQEKTKLLGKIPVVPVEISKKKNRL